ncbi:glycosyltransferase [Enterococcus ureasiticus]|uniref:glycosyltransferase n=1 Tax=Enterococcus TaxID=1350 RepID=UPI001A8C3389|nr:MULTISPECIES: glycosyltransferase [Enterococcus]MBO0434250.1 glycosyltransferase [Enterococcus sp. DIV0849a]MBO0473559.1 glycosyltransferase [Enterococcus ureasiticus]
MQKIAVSVLMSIYVKEKPEYFIQAMESTINQTAQPEEILLVEDGPLTDELYEIIQQYQEKLGDQLTVISLDKNQGLGTALAIGVEKCRNSLIARMDTDDIMAENRLEVQYQEFLKNEALTILGSNIIEFEGTPDNVLAKKHMPESNEAIRAYSKRRNPFNHMTIMFKRDAVLEVGNYQPLPGFEDYYLWVRLLKSEYQGRNLPEYLVFARTGLDMYNRRGGLKYLIPGIDARKRIYRDGLGNLNDFLTVSMVHTVICIMPNKLRGRIYKRMLRK